MPSTQHRSVSSARPGPATSCHHPDRGCSSSHTRRCADMPPMVRTMGNRTSPASRQATRAELNWPPWCKIKGSGRSRWPSRKNAGPPADFALGTTELTRPLRLLQRHTHRHSSHRSGSARSAPTPPNSSRELGALHAHLPAIRRAAGVGTIPIKSVVAPASKGLIPQPVSMSGVSLEARHHQRQSSQATILAGHNPRRPPSSQATILAGHQSSRLTNSRLTGSPALRAQISQRPE